MLPSLPLEAYRFTLEHTVDPVCITDMNSVIQWINPAYTRVTGFTFEEALGRKPSIVRSRFTTQETYQSMWATILSGGWWRGEIINKARDGREWHSFLSISQIKDEEGAPFAYVGIAKDITELKELQFRLKEASLEAIYMLSVACEAKDQVTGSHVLRVQKYSIALAERMGFSAYEAEEIGYSSMMHDVGKLYIPDAILRKSGPLSRQEWEAMSRHPHDGVAILRDKPFYEAARQIAANHHERWDGSGYPARKRGEEIPLAARIVSVADVFDALTTERSYKKAWSVQEAIKEIVNKRGEAFDPNVVDAFVSLCEDGTIGRIRSEYP
jgi:PAS domain S-box-containing protein